MLSPEPSGTEWIVDAYGCRAETLRDAHAIESLLARVIAELALKPVEPSLVHVFPGEAGVTALVLLAESHLAIHTFPEHGLATLNLYCCKPRPPWPWRERLVEHLAAREVVVREVSRGGGAP